MGKIRGLSLENFRVFKERTHFQFSPISILTGTNSSGKSSLFKALLLLKDNGEKNGLRELDFRGHYHNLGSLKAAMNYDAKEHEDLAFEIELAPDANRPFPHFELGGKVVVIRLSELEEVKDFPTLLKIYNWKNWLYFLEHHFFQTAEKLESLLTEELPKKFRDEHKGQLKAFVRLLHNTINHTKLSVDNVEELFEELFYIASWLKKKSINWDVPEQKYSHPSQAYFVLLLKKYWIEKEPFENLTEEQEEEIQGWLNTKDLKVPTSVQAIFQLPDSDLKYTYKPIGKEFTENIYVRLTYDGFTAKLKDVVIWFKERYTDELKLLYSPLSNVRTQHVLGQDGNSYYLNNKKIDVFKNDGDVNIFTSFYDFEHLHQYGIRKITNRPEKSQFIVDEEKLYEKASFLQKDKKRFHALSELIHKKLLLLVGSRVNSYVSNFETDLLTINEYIKGNFAHFLPETDEQNHLKLASIAFLIKDSPLLNSKDLAILKRKTPDSSYNQLLDMPQLDFTSAEWAALYQISIEDVIYGNLDAGLELAMKGLQQILDGIQHCFNFGLLEAHRGNTQRIILHTDESVLSKLLFDYGKYADQQAKEFVTKWLREFDIGHHIKINTIKGIAHDVIITDKKGHQLDLASLGYGISQLLPILLKIALRKEPSLLIEEPETNLHPKLQSMIANLLVDAYKQFGTQFLIETHSEYLIRKLQYLVGLKQVSSETITIYYLHNPENIPEEAQQVERLKIKDNGALNKTFGTGFYDEADNISIELFQLGQNDWEE